MPVHKVMMKPAFVAKTVNVYTPGIASPKNFIENRISGWIYNEPFIKIKFVFRSLSFSR